MKKILTILIILCAGMFFALGVYADEYTTLLILSDDSLEGSVFTDSSSAGHDVYANGDVYHETDLAHIGTSSISFDGTGDYLEVPLHNDFNFGSSNFTIDCWVNFTDNTPDPQIWTKQSINMVNWSQRDITAYLEGGALTIGIGDGTVYGYKLAGGQVSFDTWHHFAFVRSGDTLTTYLDGIQYAQDTRGGTVLHRYPFRVSGSGAGIEIDEFRVSSGIARWTDDFTIYDSPHAYNGIVDAVDNTWLLGYSEADKDALYELYEDGKNNLSPTDLTIGETTWVYYDGELPGQTGHSIGDAYTYEGKKYIYLGSGLGESAVPEIPLGAMPILVSMLGLAVIRKKL